eukprot:GHRQ01038638.1.p1 GENE.GHRQ01038638.1~~GHRQ01038638.1.p1  ORF type:complete len:143 (+),score=7.88 GHRQ01038638.1:369-797(+)
MGRSCQLSSGDSTGMVPCKETGQGYATTPPTRASTGCAACCRAAGVGKLALRVLCDGSTNAHQLQHVLVVQAAVNADLSLHLVVVELRELAPVVHLDSHLRACGLVNGQVHCRGIATAQLLCYNKLVDAPARKKAQHTTESC